MHLGYIVLTLYLVSFNLDASKLIMKGPELVLNFLIMAVIGNIVFSKIFDCKLERPYAYEDFKIKVLN